MAGKPSSYKKLIIAVTAVIVILVTAAVSYRILSIPEAQKADFARIDSEEYDTVFFSMFPADHFEEQEFVYYRGQYVIRTSYCIPDKKVLADYFKRIASSGNEISRIYLGISPDKIEADALLKLLRQYPSIEYHVLPAYPSLDYWGKLTQEETAELLSQYHCLVDALIQESSINVSVYDFFTRRWLIGNPANYCREFLVNEEISCTLMLNSDRDHQNLFTADNVEKTFRRMEEMTADHQREPAVYPDLAGYKIVFFGDSVIGNYADSASIPGVAGGLTGADVYNCGIGGGAAAFNPEGGMNLTGAVDHFIAGKTEDIPEDSLIYKGITEFWQDYQGSEKLCFVINYGLNDYFIGLPVSAEDEYEISTYSGALRTAVRSLQEAYPEAQILLMTPNFTDYFTQGTEVNSDQGSVLAEYVNAVLSTASEMKTSVLDNYAELGINAENYADYLEDGCHPNAETRYAIGSRVAHAVE